MYLFTHSQRESLMTCPRKFYWGVLLGVRPRELPKALRMGIRVEEAVAGLVPLEEIAELYAAEEAGMLTQAEQAAHRHEAHVVACMVEGYRHHFPPLVGEEVAWRFAHPLRSPHTGGRSSTVCSAGEADGVWVDADGDYGEAGGTWLVERKTSNSLKTYTGTIRTNVQIAAYVEAVEEERGIDLAGAILRVSRKSVLRRKHTESEAEFFARIENAYRDDPDAYFSEERLPRHEIPAAPRGFGHPQAWATSRLLLALARELRVVAPEVKGKRLAVFPDTLRKGLRRALFDSHRATEGYLDRTSLPFPRNHAACSMYGGCRLYALCHSNDPAVLGADFKIGRELNPELATPTTGSKR